MNERKKHTIKDLEIAVGSVSNLLTEEEKILFLDIMDNTTLSLLRNKYDLSIEGLRQRIINLSKKVCRISINTGNTIEKEIERLNNIFSNETFISMRVLSALDNGNDNETYIISIYIYAYLPKENKYLFKRGSLIELFYSFNPINKELINKITEIGTPILFNKKDIITLSVFINHIKLELQKNNIEMNDNEIFEYFKLIPTFSYSDKYICHSDFKLLPEDGLKGTIRNILLENNNVLHYTKIFDILKDTTDYKSFQSMYNALLDNNIFVKLGKGFYTIK